MTLSIWSCTGGMSLLYCEDDKWNIGGEGNDFDEDDEAGSLQFILSEPWDWELMKENNCILYLESFKSLFNRFHVHTARNSIINGYQCTLACGLHIITLIPICAFFKGAISVNFTNSSIINGHTFSWTTWFISCYSEIMICNKKLSDFCNKIIKKPLIQ